MTLFQRSSRLQPSEQIKNADAENTAVCQIDRFIRSLPSSAIDVSVHFLQSSSLKPRTRQEIARRNSVATNRFNSAMQPSLSSLSARKSPMFSEVAMPRRNWLKRVGGSLLLAISGTTPAFSKTSAAKARLSPEEFRKELRGPVLSVPTCFTKDLDVDYQGFRNIIEQAKPAEISDLRPYRR